MTVTVDMLVNRIGYSFLMLCYHEYVFSLFVSDTLLRRAASEIRESHILGLLRTMGWSQFLKAAGQAGKRQRLDCRIISCRFRHCDRRQISTAALALPNSPARDWDGHEPDERES